MTGLNATLDTQAGEEVGAFDDGTRIEPAVVVALPDGTLIDSSHALTITGRFLLDSAQWSAETTYYDQIIDLLTAIRDARGGGSVGSAADTTLDGSGFTILDTTIDDVQEFADAADGVLTSLSAAVSFFGGLANAEEANMTNAGDDWKYEVEFGHSFSYGEIAAGTVDSLEIALPDPAGGIPITFDIQTGGTPGSVSFTTGGSPLTVVWYGTEPAEADYVTGLRITAVLRGGGGYTLTQQGAA